MSLEVTGKLIHKGDTQQVSEKFKKREFVIELIEEINGNLYTNFGKFQLVQTKCEILDRFNIGNDVTVKFNIKGNKWERDGKVNYITNLDAWRIESAGGQQQQSGGYQPQQTQQQPQQYASSAPQTNQGNYNQTPNFNPSIEPIDDLPF